MKEARRKKQFNETRVGKLLTNPLVKSAIKAIPFGIGSFAGGVLDENTTQAGKVETKQMYPQLLKIAIYGALIYFVLRGSITMDEAEAAKGLLD